MAKVGGQQQKHAYEQTKDARVVTRQSFSLQRRESLRIGHDSKCHALQL